MQFELQKSSVAATVLSCSQLFGKLICGQSLTVSLAWLEELFQVRYRHTFSCCRLNGMMRALTTTWRSEMASLNRAHWLATSVATRSQKTSNPVQTKYGWSLHLMQPSIKQALQQISLKVCDLVPLTVKAGDDSSLKPSTNDQLSFCLLVLKICLYNCQYRIYIQIALRV